MYKKALQTGISHYRGPVGEIWRRGSLPGTEREGRPCSLRTPKDMKKMNLVLDFSLRKVSVGETWRGGMFTGDFERQVRELLQGKPTDEHTS
jgi:hypothetical protein